MCAGSTGHSGVSGQYSRTAATTMPVHGPSCLVFRLRVAFLLSLINVSQRDKRRNALI